MPTRTTDEMQEYYRHFIDCLAAIPEQFPVHPEYRIQNMTEADFCAGYRAYVSLLRDFQQAMCNDPVKFGLIKPDKTGAPVPVDQMDTPLMWLFTVWSFSGTVREDILYVHGETYQAYVNGKTVGSHTAIPKNIPEVLAALPEFGVHVKGEGDFTVSCDKPGLISAAAASTLSHYCKKGMRSDYYACNYRIFAYAPKCTRIPLADTITVLRMPEDKRKLMLAFVDAMKQAGYKSYKYRHHKVECGWLHLDGAELYYHDSGLMHVLIAPWQVHEHHDFIESLEEPYRSVWYGVMKCCGCRKGPCSLRFVGEVFGTKGAWCSGHKPSFALEKEEDIEKILYMIKGIEASYAKWRRKETGK